MKQLDDGVVVFPCVFELVRKLTDGLNTLRPKNQEAYRCCS